MFKFLKEKLKTAISKISESVEKSAKISEMRVSSRTRSHSSDFRDTENLKDFPVEGRVGEKSAETAPEEFQKKEEKGFFSKLKEKFVGKEEPKETIEEKKQEFEREIKAKEKQKLEHAKIREEKPKVEHKKVGHVKISEPIKHGTQEEPEKAIEKEPERRGLFSAIKEKIITTKINEEQFDRLFLEMELALMENNIAIEVIEKIKDDLKEELVEKPIRRTRIEETIQEALKNSIEDLFLTNDIDLIDKIKNKKEKPFVIAFFGINGSGKTTSIAKIAKMLQDNKISCVLAASDTFRAASIEQLEQHANKVGVKVIKHNYGADPAAVAFDAIKHAKAKSIDVVLIDTAGRMHSNANLIDELKKITRVTKPDLKIFVGESIAGNDCVNQAREFNEAVGIDGIILAKADVDEKGGAAISVSYVTKKPILYLGTGQKYSDLEEFNSEIVIKSLGLA